MRPPKTERNNHIIKMRNEGKSFTDIGKYFNISKQMAIKIYYREKE